MTTTQTRPGRPGGSAGAELLDIARQSFLDHGYPGATMDQVAAGARISKQTLYRQFPSKDVLYAAVVRDWVDRGYDAMRPHTRELADTTDAAAGLARLARVLHAGVLSAPVLQMRSLVATEVKRFPGVAADYIQRSWNRNTDLLAQALQVLADRRLLRLDDAVLAANQFTWLVIGDPLNRSTLTADPSRNDIELEHQRQQAVETFLARYRYPAA